MANDSAAAADPIAAQILAQMDESREADRRDGELRLHNQFVHENLRQIADFFAQLLEEGVLDGHLAELGDAFDRRLDKIEGLERAD